MQSSARVLGSCVVLMISACAVPGVEAGRGYEPLSFAELGGWTYTEGLQGLPERVERLSDSRVEMTGFLIPVDGLEASLVSSLGRMRPCDGPEINEIVHVTLPRRLPRMDRAFRARLQGLITVGATVLDGYVVDIYQLRADKFTLIESDGAGGKAAQQANAADDASHRS